MLCDAVICERRRTILCLQWTFSILDDPPVADIRAVLVLAAGAAGEEGPVQDVLLAPARARTRLHLAPAAAVPDHAAALATARALVAMRHCAATDGAPAHRTCVDIDEAHGRPLSRVLWAKTLKSSEVIDSICVRVREMVPYLNTLRQNLVQPFFRITTVTKLTIQCGFNLSQFQ